MADCLLLSASVRLGPSHSRSLSHPFRLPLSTMCQRECVFLTGGHHLRVSKGGREKRG